MLHQDDLKWIAKTSTELNTVLQQIARYADLAKRHKGDHDYIEQLNQQVEIASQSAQALFNRVTSKIRENTSGKTLSPNVPAATSSSAAAPELAGEAQEPVGATAPGIPSQIAVLNPEGERELILIIDDEPEIAEFASTILAEEGYKVIVAKDGFEALKIFQQIHRQIGLIILDFFLPVMDGDAVFEELKALSPSVNVVLSSGFAEQNKIGAMLAQGLRGFIPKPYTREKLLEQVRSTLDASRRPIR
jgi:CheY-like chemotaxis protein